MARRVWLLELPALGAGIANASLATGDEVVATARSRKGLDSLGGNDKVFPVAMDVAMRRKVKSAVDAAVPPVLLPLGTDTLPSIAWYEQIRRTARRQVETPGGFNGFR